jgi:predicted metalloprotease with PDZ domain
MRASLSYVVQSKLTGEPTSEDEQPLSAWVRPDWFYAGGEAIFATPELPADTPATFLWNGPRTYQFASSLDEFTPASGRTATIASIRKSTLMGGTDVRVLSDGPIRLAMHGKFSIDDASILHSASALIRLERKFWGDAADRPYLVTIAAVTPRRGERGAISGNGKIEAFALAMTSEIEPLRLRLFLAHEIFHNWNLQQLGRRQNATGTGDQSDAWLSEGFTDYYARVLTFRAGMLTLDQFIDNWNAQLIEYTTSPVQRASNAEIAKNFFSDGRYERIAYLRGELFAAVVDRAIRTASSGSVTLDNVLRDLRTRAKAEPTTIAADGLAERLKPLVPGYSDMWQGSIVAGATMVLPRDTFGPCIDVTNDALPSFDRGFDSNATLQAGMRAAGVDPQGPAYAAGLRDGMQLVAQVSGQVGDPTVDYGWIVALPDGTKETIRWKPAGKGVLNVQRLHAIRRRDVSPQACGLG